jgi:Ca2+-transporting ATPase
MTVAPALLHASTGLTEQEAEARLKADGYNELPRQERRTPLRIVLEVLREPMLALLLGAGLVYLMLGDLKEALILVAFGAMSIRHHGDPGEPYRTCTRGIAGFDQPPGAGHPQR